MTHNTESSEAVRYHIAIGGIVQGVGFRPFVYRLAHELLLAGSVRNTPSGVFIEVQGRQQDLERFSELLLTRCPPLAQISSCAVSVWPPCEESGFAILPSGDGVADIQVAPDAALCPDCLCELFEPSDRRYRYPFITCTNCGPRYSIITAIPYDRLHTTMAGFPLCPACQSEYSNPADRRFHAQPLACPECGPRLQLLDKDGQTIATHDAALALAQQMIAAGKIIAVKGLGGFHLAADPGNTNAVSLLRQRKKRDEKPFALMVADLAVARELVEIEEIEERLLVSPESPIVILRSRRSRLISPLVAPGNAWLGIMLPYTPLHHLLFKERFPEGDKRGDATGFLFPALIMTSANNSDEPIICKESDAIERLPHIADAFLIHDRPIHARSDDSVLRVFQGKPLFYRRSRGYAPREIKLPFAVDGQILAVGAELKSSICFARGERAIVSPYIGDLQNDSTLMAFEETVGSLSSLLQIQPTRIVCDLHPDYLSSVYAAQSGLPVSTVQHHHAHLAACMAENRLDGDVIGLIFDGTGFGADGTLWGGEILVGGYGHFVRAGHFLPARLPGGDAAVREPWRMALAYLYQALGVRAFSSGHSIAAGLTDNEKSLFSVMLERGVNAPWSSSCGRLFDAVAALIGIRRNVSYDGQAAIELEALAELVERDSVFSSYPYSLIDASASDSPFQIDFRPMFPLIIADLDTGVLPAQIAWHFHCTVASASVTACIKCAERFALDRVVLSGGVFQNRLLTEMIYSALEQHGFIVHTHRLTPPNDGCISLGQAAVAGYRTQAL